MGGTIIWWQYRYSDSRGDPVRGYRPVYPGPWALLFLPRGSSSLFEVHCRRQQNCFFLVALSLVSRWVGARLLASAPPPPGPGGRPNGTCLTRRECLPFSFHPAAKNRLRLGSQCSAFTHAFKVQSGSSWEVAVLNKVGLPKAPPASVGIVSNNLGTHWGIQTVV